MPLQISGTIVQIFETEEKKKRDGALFETRTLLLEVGDKYKSKVPFDFFNNKTTLLDSFMEGEEVTVHFNMRGYEYSGTWRMSNPTVWKIESLSVPEAATAEATEASAGDPDGEDDLPF